MAAGWQAGIGGSIVTGSFFATAQSVAMGGGLPAIYSIGTGALASAGAYFISPQQSTQNSVIVACTSECGGNDCAEKGCSHEVPEPKPETGDEAAGDGKTESTPLWENILSLVSVFEAFWVTRG